MMSLVIASLVAILIICDAITCDWSLCVIFGFVFREERSNPRPAIARKDGAPKIFSSCTP